MALRQRIARSGTTIEVTALGEDGWPAEAVFRFDMDPDDPSLRWLRWSWQDGGGRFVPFRPPLVRETVRVR